MRVSIVQYITLALSSVGLTSYGVPLAGPQLESIEVTPLSVMDATSAPRCWASASGVSGRYGPLRNL